MYLGKKIDPEKVNLFIYYVLYRKLKSRKLQFISTQYNNTGLGIAHSATIMWKNCQHKMNESIE